MRRINTDPQKIPTNSNMKSIFGKHNLFATKESHSNIPLASSISAYPISHKCTTGYSRYISHITRLWLISHKDFNNSRTRARSLHKKSYQISVNSRKNWVGTSQVPSTAGSLVICSLRHTSPILIYLISTTTKTYTQLTCQPRK